MSARAELPFTHGGADTAHMARVGLTLAGTIIAAFLALHVWAVFFLAWSPTTALLAPVLVALITWLSVGLFIVAHDAMHGSLAPFRSRLNAVIGQVCLTLYAGFSFRKLIVKHFAHHRHPGTAQDPDFDENHPHGFWPWYKTFFLEYFSWREVVFIWGILLVYIVLLGANPINVVLFWALPAILSSVQLFYFGTYLPHRIESEPFADRHRSRSNGFNWIVSLLTCFHFGYHHEHHLHPSVPWWRLPTVRAVLQTKDGAGAVGRA